MRWIASACALILFFAPGAAAVPITLSYSGYIDQVNDPEGQLNPAITLGAAFTADLTLNPNFIAPSAVGPGYVFYASGLVPPQPAISVTASIGGVQLDTAWDGLIIGNNLITPLGGPWDIWSPSIPVPFEGPAGTVLVSVLYSDASALKLDDMSFFVPSDSDLSGWDSVSFLISDPDVLCEVSVDCSLASGTISPAMIPEPTTALLLTLGLAGLGMRRRHSSAS